MWHVLHSGSRDELCFGSIVCACSDGSALSINVTQVAMVSLLVSASVCVSWYHSLVSVSVRPTQSDPDPVSLLFPTPLSLVVCVCQCVLSAQTPRFPGMLVEFRLFFQVTIVCASWGVSVNSYTGRDINTPTLPHAYTNLVTQQPTPYSGIHLVWLTHPNAETLCPFTIAVDVCECDTWPNSEWIMP